MKSKERKRPQIIKVWREFKPFSIPHRWNLWKSMFAGLLVVGCKLAYPWPLKHLIKPWLEQTKHGQTLPGGGEWVKDAPTMAILFFFIVLGLGLGDYLQRVFVARFAIAWVRDIRATAFRAVQKSDPRAIRKRTGDLVARLIGDTARLKAALKGFLFHVATNGALFLGVAVILFWVDTLLGVVMLMGGLGILVVTLRGFRRVQAKTLKVRKKEGKIADRIQQAIEEEPKEAKFSKLNFSSGRHEASLARIQGQTTLASQVIFAFTVLGALWVGIRGIESGRMDASDLFIFILYTKTIHNPTIRLARQGARLGKVVGCAKRVQLLIASGRKEKQKKRRPKALRREIRLEQVELHANGGRNRLAPLDLVLPLGQRIAVTGGPGSGKSSLLGLLGGHLEANSGQMLWDGTPMDQFSYRGIRKRESYLPERPEWTRRPGWALFDVEKTGFDEQQERLLRACGAWQVIESWPRGLETKIGSLDLSPREARILALARILLAPKPLVFLDEPWEPLGEARARGVQEFLPRGGDFLLLVAMGKPLFLDCFDRLLVLDRGLLAYDGPPRGWAGPLA